MKHRASKCGSPDFSTHTQPRNEAKAHQLLPSLSLFDATALSIGAIVGAGIYVVTGIAAGLAGSAVVASMLIAAFVSSLTALSFAKLAAWSPREGSVYEYGHELVSPFVGFLAGWMWILSNTFAAAAVALGFADYLTALLPIAPANWVAACICLAFMVVNYFGIRHSARVNDILVIAKLSILAFFIAFGFAFIKLGNFSPFILLDFGVLSGAYFVFFAFGGFARVAVVAEEVKDAKRNVPRAILLSLGVSTGVYVCVAIVAVGLVGAIQLSSSDSPLALAISATGNPLAVYVVSFGALVATASVLLTAILGISRMSYAMARKRDLPPLLSKIHPKHNTPHYSILIFGVLATLLTLFVNVSGVVIVSDFALLFCYAVANIAASHLPGQGGRRSRILPVVGATSCLAFLAFALFVSIQSWLLGIIALGLGTCYYAGKTLLDRRRRAQESRLSE